MTAEPLGSLDAGQHLDGKRENKSIFYTALQSHSPPLQSWPCIHRDLKCKPRFRMILQSKKALKQVKAGSPDLFLWPHQLFQMRGLQIHRHANFSAGFFSSSQKIFCPHIVYSPYLFFLPFEHSPRMLLNNEFCTFPPQR